MTYEPLAVDNALLSCERQCHLARIKGKISSNGAVRFQLVTSN